MVAVGIVACWWCWKIFRKCKTVWWGNTTDAIGLFFLRESAYASERSQNAPTTSTVTFASFFPFGLGPT